MVLTAALHQLKVASEFAVERLGRIPDDVEATAARRSVFSEGGQEDEATWSDGSSYLVDVPRAIGSVREEVKDRAIMPEIECVRRQLDRQDITLVPRDGVRTARPGKPRRGLRERGSGQIERGDPMIPGGEEAIHQRRRTGADIDDRGVAIGDRATNEIERHARLRLEPAHLVWCRGAVDVLPVG